MSTPLPTAPFGTSEQDARRASLDRRLAILFWGLLFVVAGAIWLFPAERVPDGTWLIAIGLILLFLNGVRRLNHLPVRLLPTLLGVLALGAGLAELAGARLPLVALTLIMIGASIIVELFGGGTRSRERS
jgi:hypothetical protein